MLSKLKAKNAMLKDIVIASPEDSLAAARLIMERHGIGGLPVVEEDKLVGMITHRDIILIGEIGELRVKDVMMRDIITVEEETPLVEVMKIMKEHGYQRVPVVRGEKIVGLVTQSSIIETILLSIFSERDKSMEKELRVLKIKNGTVIDHIEGGQALNVLKIIGIPETTVTIAMNVPSKKMVIKDIVKVEGRELKEEEVNKISLISPRATINIIRNYEVVEKRKVKIPEIVEGVLRCANPNCITNFEKVNTKFITESKSPIKLRCYYCERIMEQEDIVRQF